MEIKPIRHALMPKFFAVAAALAAAGTLTGCGTAGEVAQPTGLVPVEVDPAAATEMRLEGEAPVDTETETETETDEIIELAGDVEAVCDTSEVCETEEFMLEGGVAVDYEPETVCETETVKHLYAPGMYDLDDDASIQYDAEAECAAEMNRNAAEQGRNAAQAFQKAFAAYDITLVENTGCTFDSIQSVWSSTETPPRVVIYFYDGWGVHEGCTMEVHLRNAFGEAEGLRVMDWGLAYDDDTTTTAYIDVSEVLLNDETAFKIAKELLNHESDTASD